MQTSHDPFLKQRRSTNLLNSLYLNDQARAQVADLLVLNLSAQGYEIIQTDFHLHWAMECIGYSFSLPVKRHFSTIASALAIYSDWLTSAENSPQVLLSNHEYYHREILCHLSLAFAPQKDSQRQADFCSAILNLITQYIRKYSLSTETFECLLKLLLVMCKYVLVHEKLSGFISCQLVKTLIETLIQSKSRNLKIWEEIGDTLLMFNHNTWIISHWLAVTRGLTIRVLSLIYNENNDPLQINLSTSARNEPTESIFPDLDHENVIYFWYSLLQIFLKPSARQETNSQLVKSMVHLIDLFVNLCRRRISSDPLEVRAYLLSAISPNLSRLLQNGYKAYLNYLLGIDKLPMPSANDIIDLFGEWLFKIADNPTGNSSDRAEAIGALCRVLTMAKAPIDTGLKHRFFLTLLHNIGSGEIRVLEEISKNFWEFPYLDRSLTEFLLRPDGIILVLHLFLTGKSASLQVKGPCYVLLSSICSISCACRKYQITANLLDIGISAISIEQDEECFRMIVSSLCVFVVGLRDNDFVNEIIIGLLEKLQNLCDKEDFGDNYSAAIDALGIIPSLIFSNSSKFHFSPNILMKMISFMPKKGKNEEQSCRVLQCIVDWIINFPEIFNNPSVISELLLLFEERKLVEKIKGFIDYLKFTLFNHSGRLFGSYSGVLLNSLRSKESTAKVNHMFYEGNMVLSYTENLDHTSLLISNAFGTFSWRIRAPIYTYTQTRDVKFDMNVYDNSTAGTTPIELEGTDVDSLMHDLTYEEQQMLLDYKSLYTIQANRSSQNKHTKPIKPKVSAHISNKQQIFRQFLGTLGFLELDKISQMIPFDSANNRHIENIQLISEKLLSMFTVFYLPTPEAKEEEIINLQVSYSLAFQSFLNSLGSIITSDQTNTQSYSETLRIYKKGIYQSFTNFESLVLSPAISTCENNRDFLEIMKSQLIVLWNQRLTDCFSGKLPTIMSAFDMNDKTVIILTPITTGLIKVGIHGRYRNKGPLFDRMIISEKMLQVLLLHTIYNIQFNFTSRYKNYSFKLLQLAKASALLYQRGHRLNQLITLFDN